MFVQYFKTLDSVDPIDGRECVIQDAEVLPDLFVLDKCRQVKVKLGDHTALMLQLNIGVSVDVTMNIFPNL